MEGDPLLFWQPATVQIVANTESAPLLGTLRRWPSALSAHCRFFPGLDSDGTKKSRRNGQQRILVEKQREWCSKPMAAHIGLDR